MASTPIVLVIVKLALFIAVAYFVSVREFPSVRGIAAFVLLIAGAVQCYRAIDAGARADWYGAGLPQMAVGAVLLLAAGAVSGQFGPRRRKYSRARAVVTAVKPVTYGDETRWKVHFAYFDDRGTAQESVDEVSVPSWKPGDDCVAVYLPESPDLASLEWTHP